MKYPKIRELKEAVVSLFSAPYTTKFPKEAHTPFENFRGKPVVDDAKCIGCMTCSNVCPTNAITISDEKETRTRTITRDYGKCIFCGQCDAYCITGEGVVLSDKIYDMSTFDRKDENTIETQKKELLICEYCGAVITSREHIHFIHKKLGPKAYASVLNLNTLNTELKLAEESDTKTEIFEDLRRKDSFNILCPNCLRNVLVRNLRHE